MFNSNFIALNKKNIMKKQLVILSAILTLLVGFNLKTFSIQEPVNHYMTIFNASSVCSSVEISTSFGGPGVTVTIYNIYGAVTSFSVPSASIYEIWLFGEPAGRYYAVMTGNGIYEVDYFTKVCDY
jgi:hypothetical protein